MAERAMAAKSTAEKPTAESSQWGTHPEEGQEGEHPLGEGQDAEERGAAACLSEEGDEDEEDEGRINWSTGN